MARKISNPITNNDYGTIKQGAYALPNLIASYKLNDHASFQFNGNNPTNKKYLAGLYQRQGYYVPPANLRVQSSLNTDSFSLILPAF
ncbi:TonB-dependent receptor [Acinetobacter sp. ANC 4633]|uniref:TonB-dependent receptor n=1 Tax=Acinetobacter sp. ANC 4633 TaxID=2529845 RepID=UPI001D183FF8|nr:TonB-dependent receptor [Acinetobacter sp. ANC 4633]